MPNANPSYVVSQLKNDTMTLLSIVVPCFNESETIQLFYDTVNEKSQSLDVDIEYRFVNDGSKDNTLDILKQLHRQDPRVHYLSFSRNFGKEAAMFAGLQAAKGDLVVIMDADLQDPPDVLPLMLDGIRKENMDCVATRRATRKGESPIRSAFARLFYFIMAKCTNVTVVDGARDFRMMTRQVVDSILSLEEYNRFSKGLFNWIGFNVKWLDFDNVPRAAGTTKWSFWKLFKYAIDGIVDFSSTPLYVSFGIGILSFLIAIVMGLKTVIKTLFFNEPIQGYTTIIVCVTFFAAIQCLFFGIIGLYISKIYMEVKKRPIYIVAQEE